MKPIPTDLPGLIVFESAIHRDDRGFFTEQFRRDLFQKAVGPVEFIQDNHSRSKPGVLRGLHFQTDPAQGKLVAVIRGSIWDVAVDIRKGSPTYGRWFGLELSDENKKMMWISPGFAHGFCVLGEAPADVLYKVTDRYEPKSEVCIRFDDSDLSIPWPVSQPLVSAKDQAGRRFSEI